MQRLVCGWPLPARKPEGTEAWLGSWEKPQEAEFSPICNLAEHLSRGEHAPALNDGYLTEFYGVMASWGRRRLGGGTPLGSRSSPGFITKACVNPELGLPSPTSPLIL